jgi:DNA gyrase/topoisomerase IV subunit B
MEQFKVLTDREHVLARTNVYLGSTLSEQQSGIINYEYQTKTIVPALIKMIEEIYQNSVDEYIRTNGAYATKIDIKFESTVVGTKITIKDNGRGIPQDVINGKPRPVLAWTELRAGSNFDDSIRVGAGTNGMGAALTNIFSTSFIGITCDGNNRMTVNCSSNMENVSFTVTKSSQRGTSVEFTPDYERLGIENLSQDHIDIIRDRIENLAICYKGIQFTFNGERIKFKSIKDVAKRFSDHSVSFDEENVSLIISPSGAEEEFRCLSYMNGIYIKNAGTHIDFILSKLTETIRIVIKKKYKFDVLPNQIKQHLLIASWISKFLALRFDSQTKERCTNTISEVSSFFDGIDFDSIAKKVVNTPEIIDPIVEAQIRKKEAQEAAELRKKNKDLDKANLRKISKFTDATEKENRRDCMIFVSEGDSAAASILSARTSLIGCYPLRGKPLNAMAATNKELMDNKEFTELMMVTGLKIGEKVTSIDQLRFGKIVLCSDADQDGFHICGLVCAGLKKFWPELFTLGVVYRFQTPIMKTMIGKDEKYFYRLDEFESWAANQTKTFKTRYLKGLGSSTAEDFRQYFSDMESNLIQIGVQSTKDLEIVDLVFGKESGAADARKTWLDLE